MKNNTSKVMKTLTWTYQGTLYSQVECLRLNQRKNNEPLNLLTEEEWAHWQHHGYVVIKSAVSREQAQATANFLWEFEDKDPNDSTTWYTQARAEMKMKELAGTGMVEVYNHQSFGTIAREKVYRAFTDVWGTQKLWVTIDRANLNFPFNQDLNIRVYSLGL